MPGKVLADPRRSRWLTQLKPWRAKAKALVARCAVGRSSSVTSVRPCLEEIDCELFEEVGACEVDRLRA
jgi:hypothetical protein